MTLDDLDGRLFASTSEAAQLLGSDPRTVRAMARRGEIPSSRAGTRVLIPVGWLREQAGVISAEPEAAAVDLDALADRVADRVLARFASLFRRAPADMAAAGPVSPGPAASAVDSLPTKEQSRVYPTPTA